MQAEEKRSKLSDGDDDVFNSKSSKSKNSNSLDKQTQVYDKKSNYYYTSNL